MAPTVASRCIWTTEGRICPEEDKERRACWETTARGDVECDGEKGTGLVGRDGESCFML